MDSPPNRPEFPPGCLRRRQTGPVRQFSLTHICRRSPARSNSFRIFLAGQSKSAAVGAEPIKRVAQAAKMEIICGIRKSTTFSAWTNSQGGLEDLRASSGGTSETTKAAKEKRLAVSEPFGMGEGCTQTVLVRGPPCVRKEVPQRGKFVLPQNVSPGQKFVLCP